MEPILPMEPVYVDEIPVGDAWCAQIKWDGVRLLVYQEDGHVRLFNRKRRERTHHYPELADVSLYCRAKSAILDGEVIALGRDGKPDFHEVMRRDGLRRLERVAAVAKQVPVTYMIFDLLYCDGEWLVQRPLRERLDRLAEVITPTPSVQLVSCHDDGEQLFQVMEEHGMEGIVVKRWDAPYYIGEKKDVWRKIKNYGDLVAVVGGFTLNDAGVANALLLGLYDEAGYLHYIGHAGTGRLSHADWRQLTTQLTPLVQTQSPFVNAPGRARGALWVQPALTVRVQYAEWTAGHSLRQPSIQAVLDVPPQTCVFARTMQRSPRA